MHNAIDQHAAMNDLEYILKKLSRQGLIDYLTQSCGLDFNAAWLSCDKQDMINVALASDYGQEAFDAYRAGGGS
jgi:hypothetical protein